MKFLTLTLNPKQKLLKIYWIWSAIVILTFNLPSGIVKAQELNCTVKVQVSSGMPTSDTSIYGDMENTIRQFMNTTEWSDQQYDIQEHIECNLIIVITSRPSTNTFSGNINLQVARPVYDSEYNSVVVNMSQNYTDKDLDFSYVTSQPINLVENSYQNELSAILAYYAYMIIAWDMDTFAKLGGTKYFEKAQNIVQLARGSDGNGWKQIARPPRNRYWLNENFNSKQLEPIREALYEYHRLGLDIMSQNPSRARTIIANALQKFKTAYQRRSNAYFIILFLHTKEDEIINIFSKGDLVVRRKVYNILVQIQPTRQSVYKKIIQ